MSEPERIDRYEIRGILGHGAMGHVYRAWDPKLHREVAMKVVAKNLSRDTKGRQRFHREARAIAALRHPNIVEIYDYSGVESEHLYLVMEKLDGDDLFNIMNSKGMMPEAAAAAVGHELCLALQVAHEAGIIHRDLKPENVFMDMAGRVILTDFGVVKAIREDSAVDGFHSDTDVIGTPGFMAPELMMNRALGPRTDIFAMGALLYNIATGELPYEGESPVEMFRNVVSGRIRDARQYNPALSVEFIEILSECLQAKPKKRFRSVESLRERLKSVLEQNGVSDLRDDLRDYMRDPKEYAKLARRRVVGYLTSRMKVAIKDKDQHSACAIRDRLLEIDPDNSEVSNISGVMTVTGSRIDEPSTDKV
ncbi:MAG: serine/threonine protein kinase, partial [Clostridia bacterium]|nr:serine/threonine protein kinase [Deltaproteobacteria bacterium]